MARSSLSQNDKEVWESPTSYVTIGAAQLVQCYQIFFTTYQPDWVKLEAQANTSLPIELLLWISSKERRAILGPFLSHSLSLWETACKIYIL